MARSMAAQLSDFCTGTFSPFMSPDAADRLGGADGACPHVVEAQANEAMAFHVRQDFVADRAVEHAPHVGVDLNT